MSLNTPKPDEPLAQIIYRLAADTGIELKPERLQPTLHDVRTEIGSAGRVQSATLELHLDVTSRDRMKEDARRLREIADLIEAAADKPRP